MITALLFATVAHASTTMSVPAASAAIVDGDCARTTGFVTTDGGDCSMEFPVSLPSGTVISAITVEYYDTGSCSVAGSLMKYGLTAYGETTVNSFMSAGSSANLRNGTLTGVTTSNSFNYGVRVDLNFSASSQCGVRGLTFAY